MIDGYTKTTVTWEKVTATDKWLKDTLSSSTVEAKVTERTRIVRGFDGRDVTSGVSILVGKSDKPTRKDRYTIDGLAHSIVAIEEVKDFELRGYRIFLA